VTGRLSTEHLMNSGLVVLKGIPASQLLPDPLHAMALENKLEMAKMEVRQTYKMLDMSEKRVDD